MLTDSIGRVSPRYERDDRARLTNNGHRDSRLDALALIEAELESRLVEMRSLLSRADEHDRQDLTAALVSVAAEALRQTGANPLAVLREVRLHTIENF